MRQIPAIAKTFIMGQERFVDHVYDDARPHVPVTRPPYLVGTLTAGYGHTDGLLPWIGRPVTHAMARVWLDDDLRGAAIRLLDVLKPDVIAAMSDQQYAALLSFVFNVGCKRSWTIWSVINARQFDQVPLRLMQFVNTEETGRLVISPGLVSRRSAEVKLWCLGSGKVATAPAAAAAAPVVPTPMDPQPPTQSKMLVSAVASVVAALPNALSRLPKAGAAMHGGFWHTVLGYTSAAALALAAASVVFIWLHRRAARL